MHKRERFPWVNAATYPKSLTFLPFLQDDCFACTTFCPTLCAQFVRLLWNFVFLSKILLVGYLPLCNIRRSDATEQVSSQRWECMQVSFLLRLWVDPNAMVLVKGVPLVCTPAHMQTVRYTRMGHAEHSIGGRGLLQRSSRAGFQVQSFHS